jgi:class 3 adenylate cyclase/predicted ATPase
MRLTIIVSTSTDEVPLPDAGLCKRHGSNFCRGSIQRGRQMDITGWLRNLGLQQYEQAFRENDVDVQVLPELTADDLVSLGVTSVGHRRKLLAGITVLRTGAPSATDAAPWAEAGLTPASVSAPTFSDAERRQITLLFGDLVDSTPLSTRLDPEELREIIIAYQKACSDAVTRFGGMVARFLGDGVLAYFGFPEAHEDAPERAVRSGLEIVTAVQQLRAAGNMVLSVRVGIATGLVIVGDLIGSGAAQDQTVVGEAPNLAARLQSVAQPNTVVIADRTRRLVGSLFEYRDLGVTALKGFVDAIQVWEVVRPSAVADRFEALRSGTLTPLVGREEQIELFIRRWSQAKRGEGQVVLLSGEPGIGKSRMAAAVIERVAGEPYTLLQFYCSPYYTDSILHPFIVQLEQAARFEHDDDIQAKLDKLDTLWSLTSTPTGDASLIAQLLSLPSEDSDRTFSITPAKRKENTLDALAGAIQRLAYQQPVLMIFEDVQWLDPTSLELLSLVVERAESLRLLLIITYRPEFVAPWIGQAQVTLLVLNRLATRQTSAMIEHVVGDKMLPPAIIEQIIKRTDGIPLFIEELTKTVVEAGLVSGRDVPNTLAAGSLQSAIPVTLRDALAARLGRTPQAKSIAQIGAAIGREFSHEMIRVVSGLPIAKLDEALHQLIAAELIFQRGTPPSATYTFKHALVQEAAYSSLLHRTRRHLHAQIAKALEVHSPETAERRPELLAHHWKEASVFDRAIEYWHRAGELAMARSGHTEAINHFSGALDLISKLPNALDRARKELVTCVNLGTALIVTKGGGSPEFGSTIARAVSSGEHLEESRETFMALRGQYYHLMMSGRLRDALEQSEELVMLAQRLGQDDLVLEAYHTRWGAAHYAGQASIALSDTTQGIARYDRNLHHTTSITFSGHDSGVCARAMGAINLWLNGFPEQAMRMGAEGVDLARELSHPYSLAFALQFAATTYQLCGDRDACSTLAATLVELCQEYQFPVFLAIGTFFAGWARAHRRDTMAGGIELMEEGVAGLEVTGRPINITHMLALLADTKATDGAIPAALKLVEKEIAQTANSGQGFFQPELHRLKGTFVFALSPGDVAVAEDCFQAAIELAEDQSAIALKLRAVCSLARLKRAQSKRREARDLLAPVYAGFTEGFDTADLHEAKVLLDQLG